MAGQRVRGGAKWTGGRRRHTDIEIVGSREAAAIAATLGRDLRAARSVRRLTQRQVGERIGISHVRYGDLERGHGAGAPLGLWIAAGLAVGRPIAVSASRRTEGDQSTAGHLAAQELILRLARANGIPRTFEMPTRPAATSTWLDVGLRDDVRRVLSVVEIGNRIDDLGMVRRAFKRHLADADQLAAVAGGDQAPYRVAGCWVLTDTAANRELIARYPAIFASEFKGPSRLWVRALADGREPPHEPGLVWVDARASRLYEVRLPTSR
jgi:transcriptional regulator with XRE-family HTH domain